MKRRLIDADKLMERLKMNCIFVNYGGIHSDYGLTLSGIQKVIDELEFHEGEQEDWIPFTYRTPTEGEKEDHPDWDYVLDCKLPEDGQRILVTIEHNSHEPVQLDEFYCDSDGCYLDSGYVIGYGEEATAWMSLPEPWRGE